MNRFLAAAGALFLACALTARAAGPEDQYIAIYYLIQQGDTAQADGKNAEAVARYTEAQEALQKLKRAYPTWQTNVVSFRLGYLAKRLASPELKTQPPPAPVTPAPKPVIPATNVEAPAQVNTLQSQVQQLQANNSSLEAKLREALSARPAAVDPATVTQAEERIRQLAKENDLLKASLATAPTRAGGIAEAKQLEQLRKDLDDAKRKLATESARAATLAREKGDLQDRLDKTNTSPSDMSSRRVVQKQLDETKRKLDEQRAIAEQLARDKNGLTARLKALEVDAANASALREENALLRKQVTDLKSAPVPAASTNDMARRLASAEVQIAALQSERDLLKLERTALESRVKTLIASANTKPPTVQPAARAEDASRIKQLESERDTLQRQLAVAVRELAKSSSNNSGAKADELAGQLAALRAKLNVFEAKPVPFSAEELALFRQTPSRFAGTDQPARKSSSIPKPPPGMGALVVEAQRHFARGEFTQAEQKYQQVLNKDSKNVYTLANLAAIQIEANKLDDAEKNLKQAIAVAPDDAYSLQMLGYLKFRQDQYDDALTFLSQAAQFSPDNAEIQNYLGVTLSHKGQRQAAESALRKALMLEPGYGSAHNNLAVIYATQNPPYVELARWHYQKALDAGHPKNAELEKLFDKKAAAVQP